MGEIKKNVFLTGSPSIDEITQQKITSKIDLEKKYKIKFSGKEILLLQHPVTTQTTLSNIQIKNTLDAIARFKKTTIAIAPNSDAGNSSIFKSLKSFSKTHSFFKFFSTIPRSDYLGMLSNCKVLVGNSSSGIIESSYFNIAVVNIGIRQKNRESGDNIINVNSTSTNNIYQAIKTALEKKKFELKKSNIYGNGTASKKIVKILETITLDSDLIQKQITY